MTDTSRSGDLVKRLRSPGMVFYEYGADKGALLHSCADRIEALKAEVEGLRGVLRTLIDNYAPIGEPGYLWPEARAALGEKQ